MLPGDEAVAGAGAEGGGAAVLPDDEAEAPAAAGATTASALSPDRFLRCDPSLDFEVSLLGCAQRAAFGGHVTQTHSQALPEAGAGKPPASSRASRAYSGC